MSVDEIALALTHEGLRAEALHTNPEKLNVWDPSTPIWDIVSYIGPFGNTETEVARILLKIRPG